ncbi:MAG: hypothetical protein SGPRY_006987 [Prymnesium sp.]
MLSHTAQLLKPRSRLLSSNAFAQLEHNMWQKGASAYSNTFARVTRQANNTLLDMAGVHMTVAAARHIVEKIALELNGEELRVLDVACGPGSLAQAAAERGAGEVVGVDFSSEMLVAAEPVASRFPGRVRFVEGDAANLPLDDSSFDAVVIGFGLLHLPHPQSALEEAFRVLKKGGKISFSVWETPPPRTAFRTVLEAVANHGNPDVQLPDVAGKPPLPFFHFADLANSRSALAAAGFDESSVVKQVVPAHAALSDEDALFEMFATATARTRATFELQTPQALKAIKEAMGAEVVKFKGPMTSDGSNRSTSWHTADKEIPGVDARSDSIGGRTRFTIPMPAVSFLHPV